MATRPKKWSLWLYATMVLIGAVSLGVAAPGYSFVRSAVPHDFRVFYVAGLTRDAPYGSAYVTEVRERLWGEIPYLPYLNPPFYAFMMVPFTALPFDIALVAWRLLVWVAAFVAFYLIGRMAHSKYWPAYWLVAMLSMSSIAATAAGQNSHLLLFILVLGVYLLDRHHDTAGGMVLSLL